MAVDVYELVILGRIAGNPCANVLHYASSEVSAENPLAGAKALNDAYYAAAAGVNWLALMDCLPDNYFFKGLRSRRVNNTGGPTASLPGANEAGERAGAADVSGVGPVGLYHCGLVPPSTRWPTGKFFFPGVSVDDVEENVFDPALVTACNTFVDTFAAPIGAGPAGPFTQKVWSKAHEVSMEIVSGSVSLKVGTQRRRYLPI